MSNKISIRFFNDRQVRAVWDDATAKWWFAVVDVVGVLNNEDNYTKAGNYWRWLKRKLNSDGIQFVSDTHRLKLTAADGKKYLTDVLDSDGIVALAKHIPNNKSNAFLDWFVYGDNTIDGKSRSKAYELWENSLLDSIEVGTVRGLQQIHAYLFGGLYDFAGQIRQKNIAKGGFQFTMAQYLDQTLRTVEQMPSETLKEIVEKYVEMNIAHPFMEGNGRSTRIWLDLMLRSKLKKCVDWSKINKFEYLKAMERSVVSSEPILSLIENALTEQIDDRETFMKGIDYSYYYEEQ